MIEQDALKNIRNKNLSDILQVLREKGICSLSLLTQNIDGGLTTVKKCVGQAIEYGMILEGDTADSTGGRKAKQYLINKDYQYFLFLIIDNNDLLSKVYNFDYELIEEYSAHFEMKEYLQVIFRSIDSSVNKYNLGTVCLSIPCVLNDGIIMDWYYNPSAKGFDIKSELEKKYNLNVIVKNDMKLTVIGESAKRKNTAKNIATVQFGHNGAGVGEMINGEALEGNSGFAGEVSFINDSRKNIKGISFPAKVVRNIIIYINPELVIFYQTDLQNQFKRIFDASVKGLPSYSIPEFDISDDYIGSIIMGLISLINKYGYFKKLEEK